MARALVFIFGCCLALGACTQRSICPAFQSAYIYDKDELRKKFSYFQEDSTPKVLTASKTRYLIAEPTPYRKKLRSLRTVEMKPVFVQVPDSIANPDSVSMADLDRAARSVIDSTFIPDVPQARPAAQVQDSVYVITKDRELRLLKYNGADSLEYDPVAEKYVAQKPAYYVKDVGLNIEQDNYMWYLRDYLVLPDVRLAKIHQAAEDKQVAKARDKKDTKERKGLKGFFKNLFRKKQPDSDSTEVAPPPQEEFDFIDVDTTAQSRLEVPIETDVKKGFLGTRNRKTSVAKANDAALPPAENPKPTQPASREEEGF